MATSIQPPESTEYPPYYEQYISKARGEDFIRTMQIAHRETQALLGNLTDEQLHYRYAEGKWTIKEIIVHLTDAERIFAYRMLRFARKDTTDLPGFDENEYVPASEANRRPIYDLLSDFTTVRAATLSLLRSFTDEMVQRSGTANGKALSVRAIAYITCGHEIHHLNVIKERYLK